MQGILWLWSLDPLVPMGWRGECNLPTLCCCNTTAEEVQFFLGFLLDSDDGNNTFGRMLNIHLAYYTALQSGRCSLRWKTYSEFRKKIKSLGSVCSASGADEEFWYPVPGDGANATYSVIFRVVPANSLTCQQMSLFTVIGTPS
jgi:hypothetical protein